MNHPFKVSDKVVCIDGQFKKCPKPGCVYPVEGRVYVVRKIGWCYFNPVLPGVWLIGLNNPVNDPSGEEYGFEAIKFRKLDDIKQMNKESRSEGILARRRKTQPVEIFSTQDKANIAHESARIAKLARSPWGIQCVNLIRRNRRAIE